MEQFIIKEELDGHYDHERQMDTSDDEIETEIHIKDEKVIKEETDSDVECIELIDDRESTPQSSDSVAMYIKEEPAADVVYDESTPLPVTQLTDAKTERDVSVLPVHLKEEVDDSVEHLDMTSLESIHKQQALLSSLGIDEVSVNRNSECTRSVNVKKYTKCTIIASGNTSQSDVQNCSSQMSTLNKYLHPYTEHKSYECDICNKTFSEPWNLKSHLRTHTEKQPFKCDICNEAFTRQYILTSHILCIHPGCKPYKCDKCNRSFYGPSHLKRHIQTHTELKPFKCNICYKNFSTLNTLNIHFRTHTGEKPFKCDICGKRFKQSSCLNVHERTHTGVKPFECSICNKNFTRASNLTVHMRIHTKNLVNLDNLRYINLQQADNQ